MLDPSSLLHDQLLKQRPSRPSIWTYLLFVISTILLIVYTVLEIIFRDEMVSESINFSYRLQQNTPNAGTISDVIGELITAIAIAYVVGAAFLRRNKFGPWRRFLGLGFIIWLNVLLRLIYANIRPSMIATQLQGEKPFCETDFGNPSGHTIMVVPLYFFMFIDLREHRKRANILFDIIGVLCATILSLVVIFIRLYLGVHSYNQLILGSLWGIFIVLLVEVLRLEINLFILEPIFYKEIKAKMRMAAFLILIAIIIITSVPVYIFFGIRLHTHGVGSEFYNQIVNCLDVLQDYDLKFGTRIIQAGLSFNFIFAMFVGLNHCWKNVRVGLQFRGDRKIWKIFLRFLIFFLLAIPVIFIFLPEDHVVSATVIRASIIFPINGYLEGLLLVPILMKLRLVDVPHTDARYQIPEQNASPLYADQIKSDMPANHILIR